MRLLLDTHALLWWAHDFDRLSLRVVDAMKDAANEVFVSAVSAFEIANKSRSGRLGYYTALADDFVGEVVADGFVPLAVSCEHGRRAGSVPWSHKDPSDRLLVAQSEMEGLYLVSCDRDITRFASNVFW